MLRFTSQCMQDILACLSTQVKTCKETEPLAFEVLDPDLGEGFSGQEVLVDNQIYRYRGYKAWSDLAELLLCKMMTPEKSMYPFVILRFKKLQPQNSFHLDVQSSKEEKYGLGSAFSQIHKMEEPAFLHYYLQALGNVAIENRLRILNLGINRGDEFEVIKNHIDTKKYQSMELVGIDHSSSAIDYAKARLPEKNVTLYVHDINAIDTLHLAPFDLLISIGTLQSPGINFKPFFMHLVQHYLSKDAAVILGFPNSRWIDGEMIYGAKAPNYAMSEQSLLYNDVMFCKKYLQQKKYRVTITGKQYVFLTATKIL